MAIGINGNEANAAYRVGVGQYAFELLKHLSLDSGSSDQYQIYLSKIPSGDMPDETSHWRYKVFGPNRLWTLTGLQVKLIQEKAFGITPDVFFTPTHYTPLVMPIPSVVSIMDLSFEKFPQYFRINDLLQLRYWTRLSARQARKILTISRFSKAEICRSYNFPSEKVIVTYPGYDKTRFNAGVKNQKGKIRRIKEKYGIGDSDYLIFLGTLQPRKNLARLVEAFARLSSYNVERKTSSLDYREVRLVIVGMKTEGRGGWMYEKFIARVKELGLEERVIITGYIPDEDVPYLYAGSIAYILPSLYEGFGIPPVEAMATGIPAVVSRVSSLPEICGEAAVYIDDPTDVESILNAVREVVSYSPFQRAKLVDLGLERVKRYNWETTANQTLEVLKEVAGN